MKKLQYIALATIISAGALASTTFADDSGMNDDSMNKMNNKPMMMHNHGSMSGTQMGSGMEMKGQIMFEKYVRTDLTDADKAAIATIKTNHETAMKALMESMKPVSNSGTTQTDMQTKMTELKTKMQALHDQFVADLTPYIATDKVEEFKAAMSKMPVMGKGEMNGHKNGMDNGKQKDKNENYKNGQKNDNNDNKKQPINSILPTSVNKALETKLATFTTDVEKITWLTNINSKIDVLLTKTLSTKNKNLLVALRELISQKIDSINGTSTDINSILDILK